MRKISFNILIITVTLFSSSCAKALDYAKAPDTETIRQYARASQAYSAGNFYETMEILKYEKKFFPAVLLRAKAEYFYGDLECAENSFRKAIKLRSSSFEARLFLARILCEKGDWENAVKLTESLLADNPQDIRALRLTAEIAWENGKNDEASALLDKAAEFSAESALVLLDRARIRWIAGKGKEALEDLARARAMLPWDTPILQSILNLEKAIREVMQ